MSNINFSTLVEMFSSGNLTEKGLDKYVRDGDKAPVISTAKKAAKDGLIPSKLVDAWIKDGVLPEGSTRISKGSSGFVDKAGNHCIPSFYMKGASRSTDNWSKEMIKFKEEYAKLCEKFKDEGLIVSFN